MSEESDLEEDLKLYAIASDYLLQAMSTIPPKKVDDMLIDWTKGHLLEEPDDDEAEIMTAIALDACLFTPSMSGSTPLSRFLAGIKTDDPLARQAIQALSRSEIRLVRIRNRVDPDLIILEDMIASEHLTLVDGDFVEDSEGLDALMRLCRLDSGRYILISFPFALTEEAFRIVDSFDRPGRGIVNPYRCACAVYKHAIRTGVVAIPQRELTEEELANAVDLDIGQVAAALDAGWMEGKDDPAIREEFLEEFRDVASAETVTAYLRIYSLSLAGQVPASPANMREMSTLLIQELVKQCDGDAGAMEEVEELKQTVAEAVANGEFHAECKMLLESVLAGETGKLP